MIQIDNDIAVNPKWVIGIYRKSKGTRILIMSGSKYSSTTLETEKSFEEVLAILKGEAL